MNDNSRRGGGTGTGAGTGEGTGEGATRRQLFDIGSVIYSIPRTVLLNPNTEPTTLNRRRRRSGGLTISEIEENKKRPITDYPLSKALLDIQEFAESGTLVSGLQGLVEQSSSSLSSARALYFKSKED